MDKKHRRFFKQLELLNLHHVYLWDKTLCLLVEVQHSHWRSVAAVEEQMAVVLEEDYSKVVVMKHEDKNPLFSQCALTNSAHRITHVV